MDVSGSLKFQKQFMMDMSGSLKFPKQFMMDMSGSLKFQKQFIMDVSGSLLFSLLYVLVKAFFTTFSILSYSAQIALPKFLYFAHQPKGIRSLLTRQLREILRFLSNSGKHSGTLVCHLLQDLKYGKYIP